MNPKFVNICTLFAIVFIGINIRKCKASIGVPLGLIIDKEFHSQSHQHILNTVKYLNNGIRYGRNKWFLHVDILENSNSHDIIRTVCNQMSKGILAIFGQTSHSLTEAIKSYTNRYKIPFISITHPRHKLDDKIQNSNQFNLDLVQNENKLSSSENSDLNNSIKNDQEIINNTQNFQIKMHPDMVPLLVSLIKYHQWKSIYYLYNNEEALTRLEGLLGYQMRETDFVTNILARKIENDIEWRNILKSIEDQILSSQQRITPSLTLKQNTFDVTVMVDLDSKDDYLNFLNQVKFMGNNKVKYHFLLVNMALSPVEVNDFRQYGFNITCFSMVDYNKLNTLTLLSDALRINVPLYKLPKIPLKVALMIDSLIMFSNQIHQLVGKDINRLFGIEGVSLRNTEIFVNSKKGINCSFNSNDETWPLGDLITSNIINMPTFEGLTGPINFDSRGYRVNYSIDIHRVALNMPIAKIGSFSSGSGLKILEEAIFRERDGFSAVNRNRKRIVVTIADDPFFMIKPISESEKNLTGNDRYHGFCVDLATHIAKIVNFTFEFRLVKDNKFGVKNANGEWNGIIGELLRHEADLAIAGLTITLEREQAVEFSMPFMNLGVSIMIYKPKEEKPKVFSFMAPLSKEIWMCILFAYVGISVILFLVSRFSPYEWNVENVMGETKLQNAFTIFNTFWFCLAAFLQQGVDIAPSSISGRLVTSVWWFFTLILISSYTANLAAFLTVERMVSSIESAEDLAKQTEIQYGSVESGSTKEFFRTSKFQTYQRMWSFMNGFGSQVFVKNNFEGVKKVRDSKGKYAFLLESSVNEYLNERQPCDTMKVGNNLDSKGYGIATPIGSDLKEAINLAVLQLREDGTLENLKKKWWFEQSECGNQKSQSASKDASRNALGLGNVAGIFYILIIGLVISVITAGFEILYKARIDARRSKTIFKEAVKSKVRLSMTGYEDLPTKELNDFKNENKVGWNLEPPKSPF
ncbi:unnamed protein product [Brachionus calyciflorus]|uniref:Glutamate receptor 1 n=1 Tax=Brachionus calyciflorus TaxID=104777 RepID=A0A813P7H3_9BILA|nr:unnamed protein product [Brachionus calyciflorus]